MNNLARLRKTGTDVVAYSQCWHALWSARHSARARDRPVSRSTKPSRWRCSTTTACWRLEPRFSRVKPKRSQPTCGPTRRCLPIGNTLPFFSPSNWNSTYLHDSTEADIGLGYLLERGRKRQHRLQAAKDVTAQTRSQVSRQRTHSYVQCRLSIRQRATRGVDHRTRGADLKSFQQTVDLGEMRYKNGAISEDDYLKIKLQLLQFETDVQQAQLSESRPFPICGSCLGYESVAPDYDVAGPFDYLPLKGNLEDFQLKAIQNRPDLRAAQQGVTAARSQYELQKAIGKPDVTVQGNYSHVNATNAATFYGSIPLPIFNRNQGEIARTRIRDHASARAGKVNQRPGAYRCARCLRRTARERSHRPVVPLWDILTFRKKTGTSAEYAYQRGAVSLLDFLDAERNYRATQLAYRQALASYLLALEQLRQAVGTRALP